MHQLRNCREVTIIFFIEVLEDDVVDIDDSKIEVDEQLFQDIFDLPQDVPVSNVDIQKPEVLMLETKGVEEESKSPVVVINIRCEREDMDGNNPLLQC